MRRRRSGAGNTIHVPAVLVVDERVGALLIEAVEPGTPLAESAAYPSIESLVPS